MDNCNKWQKRKLQKLQKMAKCTEFVLTLRGDTLEFLSSLHKNSEILPREIRINPF